MAKSDDIFLFVQVVDEGSFSRVAEKHSLTNSVVSKRVARLERDLNVQLLYRTTRKLSLTDAGQALYGKARLAKLALQDAEDAITGYGDDIRGKIKVSAPVVSARLVVSRAIAEFCEQYPKVELELSVSNRFVDLIDDSYDLAIRTAHLEDSSLIARRLIDSKWIVCASPAYLRAHGEPNTPTELTQHQCLIYQYEGTGPDHWQFLINGVVDFVLVEGRFHTNNLDSLRQAALANFGIAYLPRALIHEELVSGTLVSLLDDSCAKDLGIYAVYPKTRQPDQKLKLLVEHLRNAFLAKSEYFF